MLPFAEALRRILALGSPLLPAETEAIEELDGRIVAEDVHAGVDLPRFDYSSMDGYAVALSSFEGALPIRLPVAGESKTGVLPGPLPPGSAMRIFTGAAIPAGADAVVMQENVTRDGAVAVFTAAPRPGQNIRRAGDDLRTGALAIARHSRLRPAHLSLAAALDLPTLPVVRRPEVVILATGDELRRPGTDPIPGTIPESNTVVLRALARRAGAVTRPAAYVRDERTATERAFAGALASADLVVTIGGVSVGDHDLVRPALEAVGVELDFWRIAMKPGKPLAVGRYRREGRRDAIVLGLPGNPSSAMVTFSLFGVPLLRAMQGDVHPFPPLRRGRLTKALVHDPGRLEAARATLGHGASGELLVTPLGNQASGAVTSMAQADALALIPAEEGSVLAGTEVDVLALADLGG